MYVKREWIPPPPPGISNMLPGYNPTSLKDTKMIKYNNNYNNLTQ